MKKLVALICGFTLFFSGCSTLVENLLGGESSSEVLSVETETSSPVSSEDSSLESIYPEESDSESSEPDSTEPEESDSESGEPDSTEPEESDSESSEPDSTEPEHDYKATVTKPTCYSVGYTTYTCTICGDWYKADETGMVAHTYEAQVVKPTCEKGGYTTYLCAVCGDDYETDVVGALGHNWVPATTESPKTCTACGKTEGEKLPTQETLETLYVHYIDVGQGDSILIKVGDCDILIDAGKPAQGTTVSNYLKQQKVDDIELMINTHLDDDHYGGLTQVLKDYVVEDAWVTSFSKSNNSITTFKNAIKSEGLDWENPDVGTVFSYGAMTLTVLYDGDGASNSNNSSIVVMLEYQEIRFLFTGDIGKDAENALVNKKVDLACDVLKVGHHGSASSSTAAFLAATGAKYGVICVGADNTYGHPTATALNNLNAKNISVYRTDLDGSVVFSTDGKTLTLPGATSGKAVATRKSMVGANYDISYQACVYECAVLPVAFVKQRRCYKTNSISIKSTKTSDLKLYIYL